MPPLIPEERGRRNQEKGTLSFSDRCRDTQAVSRKGKLVFDGI